MSNTKVMLLQDLDTIVLVSIQHLILAIVKVASLILALGAKLRGLYCKSHHRSQKKQKRTLKVQKNIKKPNKLLEGKNLYLF